MEGIPANYQGRLVSKVNFRAFIYASDGSQKLVNSWDEFENHMQTGLWFASKDDALVSQDVMPKAIKKAKKEKDVKEDDFLPKD